SRAIFYSQMAGFGHGPKLECWEPEDNPWSEHIKRSHNCGFLAIRKYVGELTVAEFYHLEQERLHIYIASHQPYPIYFFTVSYIRNCIVPLWEKLSETHCKI
uniref:Uncharacterized protein n=1 Tax=Oncorhynchus tshawytscha TaxID=74940 RepID=A0A8C8JZE7_ONCTS